MDCKRASDMMNRYFDKDLSPIEKSQFFEHLSECSTCRLEFDILEEALLGIETLEDFQAPEDFELEIMGQIDLNLYPLRKPNKIKTGSIVFSIVFAVLISTFIYFQYSSVNRYVGHYFVMFIKKWVNIENIYSTFSNVISTSTIILAQMLQDMTSLWEKSMGLYLVIILGLCSIFVFIQIVLVKLTSGEVFKGGRLYEK